MLDYDLALGRLDDAIEGEKFNQGYPVHQLGGPQNEIGLLLTSMPARSVHDYEKEHLPEGAWPQTNWYPNWTAGQETETY